MRVKTKDNTNYNKSINLYFRNYKTVAGKREKYKASSNYGTI